MERETNFICLRICKSHSYLIWLSPEKEGRKEEKRQEKKKERKILVSGNVCLHASM